MDHEFYRPTGRSGHCQVVTCLTLRCVSLVLGSNHSVDRCVFIVKATVMLHTFTAVPRSTQPSTPSDGKIRISVRAEY